MKSMTFTILILAAIAVHTQASVVESDGINTVEADRSSLKASDFKLNLRDGIRLMDRAEGWSARILNLRKSPALGGRDVQLQIADSMIKPRGRFLRHYHPRSSELVFVTAGVLKFNIEFEDGSIITNILRKGDIVVIPQGLAHDSTCLSKKRCVFIATFRTADPGLIPLPFRD